jgi:hypothetical protein
MMTFFRNLAKHDLGLRLFALALAVLIWATVDFAIRKGITGVRQTGNQASLGFRDLPVLKVSTAADVRAFRVEPAKVDVVVRGEREIVDQLTADELRVTVDLTEISSARDLRKHVHVATPPGITLVRVIPPDVDVVVPPK